VVPRAALVAEGRRWNLYRVKADGERVEEIEVKLGFEEGDRIEILGVVSEDEPVEVGQRIVVKGAAALSDDALIKVLETASEKESEEREKTETALAENGGQ
jgi:hypothetical protein